MARFYPSQPPPREFRLTRNEALVLLQCTSEIVRPDVRGNLKLVISTQARWKFGYSQEFILREKSEVIRDYRNGIGYLEMIPPLERKSFMRNDFDNGGIDIVECDCADSGCCASDASVWTDSESHSSIFMDQSDQSNSDSEWQDIENDDGLISPQDGESSSDTEDDFNRILLTNMRNANLTEFSERTREGAQNSIFKSEDLNLDGKISNDSEKESLWD
ncbi:hypothetical protein BZA77DRAFT_358916 [Pyronema omphalodes]|nr:hypothetical protein BZA77DRAFT_358916 [Pyronema omphalodes]